MPKKRYKARPKSRTLARIKALAEDMHFAHRAGDWYPTDGQGKRIDEKEVLQRLRIEASMVLEDARSNNRHFDDLLDLLVAEREVSDKLRKQLEQVVTVLATL